MNARSFSWIVASLMLVLAGCGDSREPTAMRILAAEGGTVASESAQFTIPAAALPTDTEVTLSVSPASEVLALEGGQSTILRIAPEGTVLETPAQLVIDAGFVEGAIEDSVAVHQLNTVDGERWVRLESSRDATGNVTVSVTRFAPLGLVVTAAGTAGTIEGTLSWGDASPAGGAPITLMAGDVTVAESMTSDIGTFSFGDLEAGTYSVNVDYECMLSETVELAAGETRTLALTLCGS